MASSTKRTARRAPNRWSQHVTETSDAMDLADGVFLRGNPMAIARSLKASAERSHRRKSTPFRSAMSMLNFYINRAGKGLSAPRKRRLEDAKGALRTLFDRTGPTAGRSRRATRSPTRFRPSG